jgi:hypothetical protein
MVRQQIDHDDAVNEIVISSAVFEHHLPSSIEAMFYPLGCSDDCEAQTRSVHAAVCRRYPSADIPLLVLNLANWQEPFALSQSSQRFGKFIGGWWDVSALAVTAISILTVPIIFRRFIRSLEKLQDLQLPQSKDSVGLGGLVLAVMGVVDFLLDISLCITLGSDKRWLLFGCSLGTLVATTLLSWYLGYRTLRHIIGLHQPARQWLISYPVLTPAIVIASSSRLNSMCILRLRICGHEILDFPDSPDHRYFHFLRNSGVYHYWLEDIPHALVSIALLSYEYDQVETQEGAQSGIWADLPFGSRDVAFANLLMSALSIAFGLVSKMLQQLTLKVVVRTGEERTLRTSLLEVAADLSADGWTAAGLRAAAATPRGGAGGEAGASQGSE